MIKKTTFQKHKPRYTGDWTSDYRMKTGNIVLRKYKDGKIDVDVHGVSQIELRLLKTISKKVEIKNGRIIWVEIGDVTFFR